MTEVVISSEASFLRRHRHYEKPSTRRKRKSSQAQRKRVCVEKYGR